MEKIKQLSEKQITTWLSKAVAKDSARPVLTWGHGATIDGRRAIMTCDACRAHITWLEADQFEGEWVSFKKSLPEGETGTYPDVQAVLPKTSVHVTLNVKDLTAAIKRANVFARTVGGDYPVRLTYKASTRTLQVYGASVEYGDSMTEIIAEGYYGLGFTVWLNGQFMLDALSAWQHDLEVAMNIVEPTLSSDLTSPVSFGTYDTRLALLMPFKVKTNARWLPKPDSYPMPEPDQPVTPYQKARAAAQANPTPAIEPAPMPQLKILARTTKGAVIVLAS